MSLVLDHPIVETGDALGIFEAWRVTGLADSNSHRGRIYVKSEPDPANAALVRLSIFRDRERTAANLVAQGSGTPGGRVTATAQNESGLEVSTLTSTSATAATSSVVLYVQLATTQDLVERDERLRQFLLRDPPEVDFNVIATATSRAFYIGIQADYPPPVRLADPLVYPGSGSAQEAGRRGLPEINSIALWSLNAEGEFELVGLENPGDYREWAILVSLGMVWARRARSADDPVLLRAQDYAKQAMGAWKLIPVHVDVDGDSLPERVVKVRSMRFRRA